MSRKLFHTNKSIEVKDLAYAKRYIAMCDILGFSAFIQKTNLIEAVEQFSRMRQRAIQNAVTQRVHTLGKDGYRLDIESIPYIIFSDTLLMWTEVGENDCPEAKQVYNFFDGIACLLAYSAEYWLPFRVGVSYGESYIDQDSNTYIGTPIINAYLAEQNQQWFGGACDSSCDEAPFFKEVVRKNGLVIPYEVPTKKKNPRLTNAIEWVSYSQVNLDDDFLRPQINSTKPEISIKYKNAMNFYSLIRPPVSLSIER